jgi:hypothetical protein
MLQHGAERKLRPHRRGRRPHPPWGGERWRDAGSTATASPYAKAVEEDENVEQEIQKK